MRAVMLALALAGLAACATPTPYQPQDGRYGYLERQIESNRFLVSFRGNSLTERERVETYLLYRAAELTLQNGFDYFVVTTRDTDAQRRFTSVGGGYPGFNPHYRYFSPAWGWRPWYDPFWSDPIDLRQVTLYEASAEIALFRGRKPADNVQAFQAHEVLDNLEGAIVRPGAR